MGHTFEMSTFMKNHPVK